MQNLAAFLFQNQSLRQTVAKNTFWLFSAQVFTRLLKFFLILAAARILGVEQFGSFSFALAFVSLPFLLADPGINALLIRDYARSETARLEFPGDRFLMKLALIGVAALVTLFLAPFIKDPAARNIVWLVAVLYGVSMVRDFFGAILEAFQRMDQEAIAAFVQAALTTGLGFLALALFRSLPAFIAAYIIGGAGSLAFTAWRAKIFLPFRFFSRPVSHYRKMFMEGWPFAFGAIVGIVLTTTDTVMLGIMRGPQDVGYYAAGAKLIQVLFAIPMVIVAVVFPVFSQFSLEKERLYAIVEKTARFIVLIVLPVAAGIVLMGPQILFVFFGAEYAPGALAFQVLGAMLLFVFPVMILDQLLLAVNLQLKNFQYTAIAAAVNIALNIIFIPVMGLVGAATATLLAQALNVFLTARLAKRFFGRSVFPPGGYVKMLLSLAAMTMVAGIGVRVGIPTWAVILLAGSAYGACLIVLGDSLAREAFVFLRKRT